MGLLIINILIEIFIFLSSTEKKILMLYKEKKSKNAYKKRKNENFEKQKKKFFFLMSQGSLNPKIWFLGQKVCPVACLQTHRQNVY